MKNITFAFAAIIMITFASCEKVIKVKLNSSASQYVITGNVSNEPGPYTVKLRKSVDFQQNNTFPTVSGAKVVIADQTAGVSDTLFEIAPGDYVTNSLSGQIGHTYQLYVNIDNNVFTSSGTMPVPVPLDSLYQQPAEFGEGVSIVPMYTDPAGKNNFYHFIQYIDGKRTDDLYYRRDLASDGKTMRVPLNLGADTAMHVGSTVTIDMESIDSAMLQYYRSLDETIEQNSATPSNPLTNINGAKLGYFSVHATSTKSIIIY